MKNYHKIILLISILILLSAQGFAQTDKIMKEIEKVIENKNLTLGLSVYDFQTGYSANINGAKRFPMQSVYKFPISIALLDMVDKGVYNLTDTITITAEELIPDTWSPIREKHPDGIKMPLSEVIRYTIAESDNIGSDILMAMIGGALRVENTIHSKGVNNIRIANTEKELHTSWDIQFANWTTPDAMVELLKLFNSGSILESDTNIFLWNTMASTSTGSIKKLLPPDVSVAHKTGSSGQNTNGITAALNDVGIIELPNNRRIAIAIFITDSQESPKTNSNIISQIAEIIYRNLKSA